METINIITKDGAVETEALVIGNLALHCARVADESGQLGFDRERYTVTHIGTGRAIANIDTWGRPFDLPNENEIIAAVERFSHLFDNMPAMPFSNEFEISQLSKEAKTWLRENKTALRAIADRLEEIEDEKQAEYDDIEIPD